MEVVGDDLNSGDPKSVLGWFILGFARYRIEPVGVFDKLLGHGQPVYNSGGYLGKSADQRRWGR
jgi:hypothetical protein